jgi:hypothetical protein
MNELMVFPARVTQFLSDLVPFLVGMVLVLTLYACVRITEARRRRTGDASRFEGIAARKRILVLPAGRKSLRSRNARRPLEGGEVTSHRGTARSDAPVA